MSTKLKNNVLTVLSRLSKLVQEDQVDLKDLAIELDEFFNNCAGADMFGTEGQLDPRGDFREPNAWTVRNIQWKLDDAALSVPPTIWAVTGHSESGDDYGPLLLAKEPTKKELKKIAYGWDGNDEEDGPGYEGSYVHIKVQQCKINN